jgi:hypothetical protein
MAARDYFPPRAREELLIWSMGGPRALHREAK